MVTSPGVSALTGPTVTVVVNAPISPGWAVVVTIERPNVAPFATTSTMIVFSKAMPSPLTSTVSVMVESGKGSEIARVFLVLTGVGGEVGGAVGTAVARVGVGV